MNISRILSTAALVISLSAAPAFAESFNPVAEKNVTIAHTRQDIKDSEQGLKDSGKKCDEFRKDPVKALEAKKAKIQTLLKEGKITKEKAEEITARIDTKIKEIESFNKLSLQQKKDKLISDCRSYVEKQVKEGKLDRAKADELIKKYTEKINKWDGSGYPKYHSERSEHRFKGPKTEK